MNPLHENFLSTGHRDREFSVPVCPDRARRAVPIFSDERGRTTSKRRGPSKFSELLLNSSCKLPRHRRMYPGLRGHEVQHKTDPKRDPEKLPRRQTS
jgi:hypothetical protein